MTKKWTYTCKKLPEVGKFGDWRVTYRILGNTILIKLILLATDSGMLDHAFHFCLTRSYRGTICSETHSVGE